jgi:hypothetical protein
VEFLFVLLLFAPIVLNAFVWWRLRHAPVSDASPPWRIRIAYLGLWTNSLAYAIPWAQILYSFILLNSGRPVPGDDLIDGRVVIGIAITLAALSGVFGAASPKHVRIQLLLSALSVACLWLSIPMGVL